MRMLESRVERGHASIVSHGVACCPLALPGGECTTFAPGSVRNISSRLDAITGKGALRAVLDAQAGQSLTLCPRDGYARSIEGGL